MAEILDEASHLESTTVLVSRTAATVKGGRRFSFNSLVVVGDRRGQVGLGYGKANEVPPAIEKAQKEAKKSLRRIPLLSGTIPHEVTGRFGSVKVRIIPASPGTGVVAGAAVRSVLEMVGITDCLTKCYGSTNKQNVVKAVFNGLLQLKTGEQIAAIRGVEIGETLVDEMIKRGEAFAPTVTAGEKMKAPVNLVGQDKRGGQRGGGRRGGGGGRGGAPTPPPTTSIPQSAPTSAPAVAPKAPEAPPAG